MENLNFCCDCGSVFIPAIEVHDVRKCENCGKKQTSHQSIIGQFLKDDAKRLFNIYSN